MASLFPNVAKFANLRCGLWYHAHFDNTCYFKSTDGHTYHWQFSLNRLNLHVLKTALTNGAIMIIDSTRKGKLYPDSFSRTVPIWCCVMNRVLETLRCGVYSSPLKLPPWVHDTEKDQIEEKINEWVSNVLKSGVDLSDFVNDFLKPLQCVWISRRTDLDNFTSLNTNDLDFIPIILVSASDPDHPVKTTSWVYIQGAGDDHESWAMGLTPQLFWEHEHEMLSPEIHSGEECEVEVRRILEVKRKGSTLSDMQHSYDSISISSLHVSHKEMDGNMSISQIGHTPIHIGIYTNCRSTYCSIVVTCLVSSLNELNHYFEEFHKSARFVCCTDMELELSCGRSYLLLDNKKNKRGLEDVLGEILLYVEQQLESDRQVFVLGRTGKNEEICVAIAIIGSMFDDQCKHSYSLTFSQYFKTNSSQRGRTEKRW